MTSRSSLTRFRSALALGAAFFAALLLADAASAAQYTIQLHNGTEIGTLRQPREASWDRSMVMVLTETGNWMAIPQEDIKLVIFEIERRQMGKVIDEKTVFLGLSMNEAPTDEEEAEREQDPFDRLREMQERANRSRGDNSVQQFVRPGSAGGSGISASNSTSDTGFSLLSVNTTTTRGGDSSDGGS